MRELLAEYERLARLGPVGRAVVTRIWGSAPRQAGATMLVGAAGPPVGSVSGGCVENAVTDAVKDAVRSGEARVMRFEVSDDRAWEVGLSCGGTLHVLAEPEVAEDVLAAARAADSAVVVRVIGGAGPLGIPTPEVRQASRDAVERARVAGLSSVVEVPVTGGAVEVFLEVMPRRPTLLIIGAVHIARDLAELARPLGYHIIVADARGHLLDRSGFPDGAELVEGWPAEVFERFPPDRDTFVCILSHDPKFDEPAIALALASPARYVGAIGSRRTQARRRERLLDAGVTREALDRLRAPIGLDLGGRAPAEIALAILAEMTAVRYGGRDQAGT